MRLFLARLLLRGTDYTACNRSCKAVVVPPGSHIHRNPKRKAREKLFEIEKKEEAHD